MDKFQTDLRNRGQPWEAIIVETLKSHGIPAFLNPGTAYLDLAAYDIGIGTPEVPIELWDAKADWMSLKTGNLCVERASLEHTRSSKFVFIIPNYSGFYLHVFTTAELIALFNAQIAITRPDGGRMYQYTYKHMNVGDQATNMAVLLPKEITETVGHSFWQEVKQLMKTYAKHNIS